MFWPIATVETSMGRSKFDFFLGVAVISFLLTSGERAHQVNVNSGSLPFLVGSLSSLDDCGK